MAGELAYIHSALRQGYARGEHDEILEIVGERTARLMEMLGDALKSMDAVDEYDSWLDRIFAEAHKRWPTK